MNYSFEYIDIILLAMIAGFIFLRLRGILGKRTGFEGKAPPQFQEILKNIDPKIKTGQKENFDEEAQKNTAGALYDMLPPITLVTKPAGEWNSYHITINHNKNEGIVIHNGVEINRFPLHGPKWDEMVSKSKFAVRGGENYWDEFGKHKTGHICLQDHPGVISYRNIKIKEL